MFVAVLSLVVGAFGVEPLVLVATALPLWIAAPAAVAGIALTVYVGDKVRTRLVTASRTVTLAEESSPRQVRRWKRSVAAKPALVFKPEDFCF